MRAQSFRERGIIWTTPDRCDSIAELVCELNSQVAKPADSLHGDKIAWQRAVMTESIECRDSSTHQRRGFGGVERFGHASQCFDRGDHEFLIASVVANSANLHICAVDEITSSARQARPVLAAVPADADPFAFLPVAHTRPDLIDHADYFVSGNTWIRHTGKQTIFRDHIAMADSTRLNTNPHMSRSGLRNFTFHEFEIRTRLWYLHHFHSYLRL